MLLCGVLLVQITSHDVHKTVGVLKTILEEAGLELDPLRRLPPFSPPTTEVHLDSALAGFLLSLFLE